MKATVQKRAKRTLRHKRGLTHLQGTFERPRLSVFRSLKNISCQLIDDNKGVTLVAVSSKEVTAKGTKTEIAMAVGKLVAEKAKALNINTVVFDRGGNKYHGRVKAVADGAREGGLTF